MSGARSDWRLAIGDWRLAIGDEQHCSSNQRAAAVHPKESAQPAQNENPSHSAEAGLTSTLVHPPKARATTDDDMTHAKRRLVRGRVGCRGPRTSEHMDVRGKHSRDVPAPAGAVRGTRHPARPGSTSSAADLNASPPRHPQPTSMPHRPDIRSRPQRPTASHPRARHRPAAHSRPYPTALSLPSQYGARSSRLSTFPGPDLGSASCRMSMPFGTL